MDSPVKPGNDVGKHEAPNLSAFRVRFAPRNDRKREKKVKGGNLFPPHCNSRNDILKLPC
jgi:hypothetical protein